jgi:hypothetical protein
MTEIKDRISDPETQVITREQAGFRLQGGVPGRRCGDCRWNEASVCTRGIVGVNRVDYDDVCDEYRRNFVDGSMSNQEAQITMTRASLTTRGMNLFINRVSEDPQTGQRRWYSTSSGVKRDLYGERMSIGLFKDFIKRIEKRETPPEPFTSKAWNGGLPYLGIAHYLDLEGDGIAGSTTKVWRDGTHLKMKGIFEDNVLGKAAYEAVKRDIANNVPPDQRVRVSIAFVDWGHEHEGIGHFERKSLTDKCDFCDVGNGDKIYRKGHLVHLALTRQPAYPEADIQLEEKSMSQRKLDAASIVGEELAENLEKKAAGLTERSAGIDPNAIVIRQEEEAKYADDEEEEEMDGEESVEAEEEDQEVEAEAEEEEEEEEMVYESLGGAVSLDEADEYLTRRSKDVPLLDSWAIFASVLANIAGDEGREAVYQTVADFQDRLDVMALRALMKVSDLIEKAEAVEEAPAVAEEPADEPASEESGGTEEVSEVEEKSMQSHPLDEALVAMKDTFDIAMAEGASAEDRLQALQGPMNELAAAIRKSVAVEDGPMPTANNAVVKAAIAEAVAPLQAEIASLQAQLATKSEVKPEVPTRRAISLTPATNVVTERSKSSKYPDLKSMIRRSVGINE